MRIPYDKKLHIGAGFVLALSSFFIGIYGLVLALLAGIFKEVFDYFDYGKPDVYDALATWCGGVIGFTVVQMVRVL